MIILFSNYFVTLLFCQTATIEAFFTTLAVTWFYMNRNGRMGKLGLDLIRKFSGDPMRIHYRHMGLHLQVKLNETEMSRLACPQIMKAMNETTMPDYGLPDPLHLDLGKMNIEEVLCRLGSEVISRLYNQQGNTQGGNGIYPEEIIAREQPLGDPDQDQAAHDSNGGIYIRAEMPGIRLQGDGIGFPANLEEHLRYGRVGR